MPQESAVPPLVAALGPDTRALVGTLLPLAARGLARGLLPDRSGYAFTLRTGVDGRARPEGRSARYTAIAALALARTPAPLREQTRAPAPPEVVAGIRPAGLGGPDRGVTALTVWAAAEAVGEVDVPMLALLRTTVLAPQPLDTVVCAWALTAALAVLALEPDDDLALTTARAAKERLLRAQGPHGLFPHVTAAVGAHGERTGSRLVPWRARVGSFADQVYPLQALARYHRTATDPACAHAADRAAAAVVRLQGDAGQWWWHYDVRSGSVTEGYPVYSVHQHGMAPMALQDLELATGTVHRDAVERGLRWLLARPERGGALVEASEDLVWRKVGRADPGKLVRRAAALTASVHPGGRARPLARLFPPGVVDRECRPYEFAWLLYAWCAPRPEAAR